jgi:zinc protease
LTSIIGHAEPGPIRRFYHDWYRPDLMAVIVVGDVDPARVEQWIRARFGSIPAPARPRARVSPLVPGGTEPVVDVYRGPVNPDITVLWNQPALRVVTKSALRQQLVEQLLFDGLSRRFLELREQTKRPFLNAAAGRTQLAARTTDAILLRVVAWPDSLESGLAATLTELERTARYGIPASALEHLKLALLRQFESAALAAPALPSAQYASDYTQHYLREDTPLLSPAQRLTLAREVLPTITSGDLARAARFWHGRSGLKVLVTFPAFAHVRPPTRESVLAVLDSVARAPLQADTARAVADAPLVARPPVPGRIVRERREVQAGITEWTLSNGARVILKPSHADADALLIKAVSPGGFSLVPDSLFFTSGRLVARMMTEAAGVGALDRNALLRKLSTTLLREFTVSITNNDESISLGGSPKDMATLFELLYLQFTAPKLDTTALAAWKQVGTDVAPSGDEQLTYILSRGDPRRAPTPGALIQFADLGKAMEVYQNRFGNAGDFTFIIVGNVRPSDVRPLVERYLASLPSSGQHEVPKALTERPWSQVARETMRLFDIPKASTLMVFDGLFPSAPDQYRAERQRLAALAWVLRLKLTDDLRERRGGTYSVAVQEQTYADPEEHYRIGLSFDAAPEAMDTMQDALFTVLDSVRSRGASLEELGKVAAIQRRTHEMALQDPRYWLRAIELYDRLKIPFDRITAPPLAALSPADIRKAAQDYLPAGSFIQLTMLPTDSSSVTPDDSRRARSDSTTSP